MPRDAELPHQEDVQRRAKRLCDLERDRDPAARQTVIELAEIVAGRKPGRRSTEEGIVFDSTGTALQDVAAARLVYQNALVAGAGVRHALGAANG